VALAQADHQLHRKQLDGLELRIEPAGTTCATAKSR
jgi:hypothetical protein